MLNSTESQLIFGKKVKCPIIAEIGVNHDGDIGRAKQLSELAIECGADLVKFQIFDSEEEISEEGKILV